MPNSMPVAILYATLNILAELTLILITIGRA